MDANEVFTPCHLRLLFPQLSAGGGTLWALVRGFRAHDFLFAEVLGHLLPFVLLVINVVLAVLLWVLLLLDLLDVAHLVVRAREHFGEKSFGNLARRLSKFSEKWQLLATLHLLVDSFNYARWLWLDNATFSCCLNLLAVYVIYQNLYFFRCQSIWPCMALFVGVVGDIQAHVLHLLVN